MSHIVPGCANCQKPLAKLRCGKCKLAYYCNKECQKDNWSVHKNVCQDLKDHGEQKDNIVKNFISKNQELYQNALMMSKFLGNHSRFVVFTKNNPEQKDICYMTEDEIRKSITPPEILEDAFWKATFQMHKDKKENEISVIIPYFDQGGHYHFLTKI